MKKLMIGLFTLGFAVITMAGDGYVETGKQGIMHFVQIDKDKATDVDTYRGAKDDLCDPAKRCQVIFWTENAPVRMPFSREQSAGRTAYWQWNEKTQTHRLYVDCKLFGTDHEEECF